MRLPRRAARRAGTSYLVLAAILSAGLLSLGIAARGLARRVQDASLAAGPLLAAKRTPETPDPDGLLAELPAPRPVTRRGLGDVLDAGDEPLRTWTLFADQGLCVDDRARVEGDGALVGGNGDLWVRGESVVAAEVRPGPGARLHRARPEAVRGQVRAAGATRELPWVDVPRIDEVSELELEAGRTRELAAGDHRFEATVLPRNATLRVTGPARLVFDALALEEGARIVADGGAGPVELHALGDVSLASHAQLVTAGGSPDELLVHFAADTLRHADASIDLSADAQRRGARIEARVYAPEALVVLDGDLQLRGGLVAGAIRVRERARVLSR